MGLNWNNFTGRRGYYPPKDLSAWASGQPNNGAYVVFLSAAAKLWAGTNLGKHYDRCYTAMTNGTVTKEQIIAKMAAANP